MDPNDRTGSLVGSNFCLQYNSTKLNPMSRGKSWQVRNVEKLYHSRRLYLFCCMATQISFNTVTD